ncbi:MAG TPA: LamG-like jellyroll fold domain-containing protein, partial [Candidatus Nitrosotalea sp.]|nr:LamG-like jellyroll fold domain-containing protein [Candidatus Nitrosotalea sp.]
MVGQAFSFNGTSNYVQVGNNPALNFSNVFSFEAWIFPTGTGSDPNEGGIIIGKESQYMIGRFADGSIHWAFANASPGWNWASTGFVAPPNQWTHLVITYDNGVVNTYANGILIQTYVGSGPTGFYQQGQNDFRIGGRQAINRFFQGRIDEVSVYNRALSAGEAALLHSAGGAGKITVGPYLITASQLPDGVTGQFYSQVISAIRGAVPLAFAVTNGTLPPGLALTTAGVLSGTPTAAGSFNFTVRVTDGASLAVEQEFTLQVFVPVSPPPGIVAWWRAEADALDSVGTNHGTLRNGVSFVPGKAGQAFSLDGASQSIEIPDAPALRPTSLTVEGWILFNAANGIRVIFAKPVGTGILDSFGVWLENGNLKAVISDVAGSGTALSIPFSPAPNQWHHIAFTFDDGTKQQALYLDGAQVASGAVNKSIGYDNHPMLLGRDDDNGAPGWFVAGGIDEAALYNRALSATEIASLYGAGPAGRTVAGPYFTTAPLLPDAVVQENYAQTIATLRGTPPVIFSLTAGALPSGMTLSSNGLLAGTPTTPGRFDFVVHATDGAGLHGDQAFTLPVWPRVSPPASLVGWWRGENNAQDSAGTNDGFLVNGATFAPGHVGQAFSLDGVDDYIEIEDAPELRPASLTLEAWVMFFSSGGVQSIITKTLGNGTADSFALWLENGSLNAYVADVSSPGSGASGQIGVAFTPVLGRWYHVGFTFDNSTKEEWLYLDGVAVATGLSNRSIDYDDHPVLLGADIQNSSQNLVLYGRIDEAAIYNRALSPPEIASLHNAGSAGKTAVGPYIDTPPVLPDGSAGLPYTQTITSVRGTAPVAYTVIGGMLPGGLTLTSGGVLSGVPSVSGTFNFVVRVTDAVGLFGDQTFTLEISAPIPPPAGLIGWWRAEGNALDSAGTNHGVLNNGVTFAAGKAGEAFALDGLNDFIQIADAPALRPASVTLETWVMFMGTGTRAILSKPVGSGVGDSYQIYISGGNIGGFVSDASGPGTQLTAPFSPALGQWYHVAYTFDDATRQQVLYIDGVTV